MTHYDRTYPESLWKRPAELDDWALLITELNVQDTQEERQEILDDLGLELSERFKDSPGWKDWQEELTLKAKEPKND